MSFLTNNLEKNKCHSSMQPPADQRRNPGSVAGQHPTLSAPEDLDQLITLAHVVGDECLRERRDGSDSDPGNRLVSRRVAGAICKRRGSDWFHEARKTIEALR